MKSSPLKHKPLELQILKWRAQNFSHLVEKELKQQIKERKNRRIVWTPIKCQ